MTVLLSPVGGVAAQFLDNNGNPLSGGKLFSYAAGTTTPAATYTSSLGVTAHTNPIVLDSGGRVPGGETWLTDGIIYKFVLQTSTNVLIATYDNIVGINSNFVNYTAEQEIQTATAGQTVFNLTTTQYQPGTNSLTVYVDGVNQYGPGAQYAYLETDSDTVTFVSGLHVGASVKFTTATQVTGNATDASVVAFTGFKGQVGTLADLADDDGSDWIGFDPAGSGAVARSAQDKLRETVSVMDFGAVGDGVTDDTAAIQAAIDASNFIYFPLPQVAYKTTVPIVVTGGKYLYGQKQEQNTADYPSVVNCLILKTQGSAAFQIQGNYVAVENISVLFDKAVISDFSNTADIGFQIRAADTIANTNLATWSYLNTIDLRNVSVGRAYKSIEIEKCFFVSLENVSTFNDFFGVAVNVEQTAIAGTTNVPGVCTTVKLDRVYCRGTQTIYATPVGSVGMRLIGIHSAQIYDSVTEAYEVGVNASTSDLLVQGHYFEKTTGIAFRGNGLANCVIESAFCNAIFGTHCFEANDCNLQFIGGRFLQSSGATFWYKNGNANGSASFISLPRLGSGKELYANADATVVGGLSKEGFVVISNSSPARLRYLGSRVFLAATEPFVSGVAKVVTGSLAAGGIVYASGFSASGSYSAILNVNVRSSTVGVVNVNNTTGGTIAFAVDGSSRLTITSTGTSSQLLLDAEFLFQVT